MTGAPGTARAYPSKPSLSTFEARRRLQHGPDLDWFRPWATPVVVMSVPAEPTYGYVHTYGATPETVRRDVVTWSSAEGLRWGLESLYAAHSECQGCQGVLFFTAEGPLLVHLVAERDHTHDLDEVEADK